MSLKTKLLELFKYEPDKDGAQTFNIQLALNDNWDKIEMWAQSVKTALTKLVPTSREVNGKALSADVTLTGENIAVSTTDSTPISGAVKYRTNPNLLDNWYFGRPVNQRGLTEYTAAGYTIDRWKLDVGGAVTLEDGCICLKKSGTYWGEYFADFDQFIGMTLTGSVLLSDGTLRTGSFVYNGSVNQAQTFFSSELGFYIQKLSNSQTQCEINSLVDNVKIKAAKLELGDTQTLAHKENGVWVLNEIPDFGEQLARCQRYLFSARGTTNYVCVGSGYISVDGTEAIIVVPTPVSLRATPVCMVNGILHVDTSYGEGVTGNNVSLLNVGNGSMGIRMKITGSATPKSPCFMWIDINNNLLFSADL